MKVLVLADTPNLFHTVQDGHGMLARPDYAGILDQARVLGDVVACAFVNPGVSRSFVDSLAYRGFRVIRPRAADVDDALVAEAVALHSDAFWVVLCSGDGDYLPLMQLLQTAGRRVAVMAVERFCHRRLVRTADKFIPLPIQSAANGTAAVAA